jgi:hypothetical protein
MRAIFRTLHHLGEALTESPLFWAFAFVVPLLFAVMLLLRLGLLPHELVRFTSALLPVGAATLIVAFVANTSVYLWSANFVDHVEPLVAQNSWLFWRGDAIYHALDTEQRYNTPYGPYVYIVNGITQGLLGPSTFTSKLSGGLAAVGSLLLVWLTVAATTSHKRALLFTGLAAGFCLAFRYTAIWNRPDPFLLFTVALGLFAVKRGGRYAPAVLGAAIGIAVDLKTHGALYFVPLLVLAQQNSWGKRAALATGVTAFGVAMIPFVIFPHLSLGDYLFALCNAAGYSLALPEYRNCIEWLATFFVPATVPLIFSCLTNRQPSDGNGGRAWSYLGAIFLSCVPVLIPGTQMAAGAHHLMPFIPLLVVFAAEQGLRGGSFGWPADASTVVVQSMRYSWLISCGLVALWSTYAMSERALRTQPEGLARLRDVKNILASRPHNAVVMGLDGEAGYLSTLVRHELVFAGMPPGIDSVAAMDGKGGGLPESNLPRLVDELSRTAAKPLIWLIPRGATPFTKQTVYAPYDSLFTDEFRANFSERFERMSSSEFFDLYEAKRGYPAAE